MGAVGQQPQTVDELETVDVGQFEVDAENVVRHALLQLRHECMCRAELVHITRAVLLQNGMQPLSHQVVVVKNGYFHFRK